MEATCIFLSIEDRLNEFDASIQWSMRYIEKNELYFLDLVEQKAPLWKLPSTTTKTKSSVQGAQEPGHLPKAIGQAVQVYGQTKQLQPSGSEEVVHQWHSPAASVPFPGDSEHEASWQKGKTTVVVGIITDNVHAQGLWQCLLSGPRKGGAVYRHFCKPLELHTASPNSSHPPRGQWAGHGYKN